MQPRKLGTLAHCHTATLARWVAVGPSILHPEFLVNTAYAEGLSLALNPKDFNIVEETHISLGQCK